ncbi:MAG: DUF3553 domain-containing protein [Pseudomonadota bacterium]
MTGSGALGLEPGGWVRHPDEPDWGVGQIQSIIGDRVTINFEHAGKRLIQADQVSLKAVSPDELKRR